MFNVVISLEYIKWELVCVGILVVLIVLGREKMVIIFVKYVVVWIVFFLGSIIMVYV